MATLWDSYFISVPLTFDVRWPVVGINLRGPFQERRQCINLFVCQIELWHLPPAWNVGGHGIHPGIHVGLEYVAVTNTTAQKHVSQFRSKVRAFTQERVATDTVVLFPDMLPVYHLLGELIAVIPFGHSSRLSVKSQHKEQQNEEGAASYIYVPGHAFGKALCH